jgi:dihydrodipicolinate synthase/N-acetylneuraminate lyase
MPYPALNSTRNKILQEGIVIPAHPLALNSDGRLDEMRQRRLTRYYLACGAGGVAVGVHTTQFEIRRPNINLLETVLNLAAEEVKAAKTTHPIIKVAGIVGPTSQGINEAKLAVKYDYDLGLVSMGGLANYSETQLIDRVKAIAEIIPIFGFYLQPAVGGRILSYNFWRAFADIPNVYAIKVAAFNRYQTLDVVRAVCDSERRDSIALYTGNDDNIIGDLITPYRFKVNGSMVEKRFVGGLLGHWAVWTNAAVKLLDDIKNTLKHDRPDIEKFLAKNVYVTDMNAAVFDVANSFHGCIPGIHEVLRRQGLLEGTWCLNPDEKLSEGQMQEINRVCENYPDFTDDEFVKEFLLMEEGILK